MWQKCDRMSNWGVSVRKIPELEKIHIWERDVEERMCRYTGETEYCFETVYKRKFLKNLIYLHTYVYIHILFYVEDWCIVLVFLVIWTLFKTLWHSQIISGNIVQNFWFIFLIFTSFTKCSFFFHFISKLKNNFYFDLSMFYFIKSFRLSFGYSFLFIFILIYSKSTKCSK